MLLEPTSFIWTQGNGKGLNQMMDFGSTRLTSDWGYQAFAKRRRWSKLKWESRMELPLASWPLLATPSAARQRRLIYQARSSLRKLTGAAPGWGHMTCRVISHDLCWRQWASGWKHSLHWSIRNRIELFCIGANLVQSQYDGSCFSMWMKKSSFSIKGSFSCSNKLIG